MKLFIYKLLISFVAVYILFQLTVGLLIVEIKKNIFQLTSSENTLVIKEKIREEIKSGIEKDRILNKSDSILIKKFFDKIKKELENTK